MPPCEGWSGPCKRPATQLVSLPGCTYCGGGDCGDTGDLVRLCDDCAHDCADTNDGVELEPLPDDER